MNSQQIQEILDRPKSELSEKEMQILIAEIERLRTEMDNIERSILSRFGLKSQHED